MQKWIKKYWPVLLALLAIGYIIYTRRKNNKAAAATGTNEPANTTPVEWGANPAPENNTPGIAVGEPVPGTGGTMPQGGGSYLPVYDPNAGNVAIISDPEPWKQQNDAPAGNVNYSTINFG